MVIIKLAANLANIVNIPSETSILRIPTVLRDLDDSQGLGEGQ